MIFLYILGFLSAACGLYLAGLDLIRAPDHRTRKTLRLIRKHARPPEETRTGQTFRKLERKIRLPRKLHRRLGETLRACGWDITPEAFLIRTAAPPLLLMIAALLVFSLSALLGFLFALGGGLSLYVGLSRPAKLRQERRREIERELPWLVFTVSRSLGHDREVFRMLDRARPAMGPVMRAELDYTLADMQSAHPEAALLRWEKRIGSPDLSAVVRGLVAVMGGDDTKAYWVMTAEKLGENQKQSLREKAQKVPKKVRRVSLCILVCFMLTYAVVIGGVLVGSLGGLFG